MPDRDQPQIVREQEVFEGLEAESIAIAELRNARRNREHGARERPPCAPEIVAVIVEADGWVCRWLTRGLGHGSRESRRGNRPVRASGHEPRAPQVEVSNPDVDGPA